MEESGPLSEQLSDRASEIRSELRNMQTGQARAKTNHEHGEFDNGEWMVCEIEAIKLEAER